MHQGEDHMYMEHAIRRNNPQKLLELLEKAIHKGKVYQYLYLYLYHSLSILLIALVNLSFSLYIYISYVYIYKRRFVQIRTGR